MVNCNIKFDNNAQAIYYSGQVLSGVIELNNEKARNIRGLSLKIEGFAKVVKKRNNEIGCVTFNNLPVQMDGKRRNRQTQTICHLPGKGRLHDYVFVSRRKFNRYFAQKSNSSR
jgi:hypothetical protein